MRKYNNAGTQIVGLFSLLLMALFYKRCLAVDMSLTTNLSLVNLDCSGLVSVRGPIRTGSFLLNYNPTGTTKNTKKCIWTLDTSQDEKRYNLKAKIILIRGYTDSRNDISVVSWKSTKDNKNVVLSHQELTLKKQIYESKGWDRNLYLSYISSSKNQESGFVLLVKILETQVQNSGTNLAHTNGFGEKLYNTKGQSDTFSMTVTPKERRAASLTIKSLTSNKKPPCSGIDTLDVYEMSLKSPPRRLDRVCGKLKSPISYNSTYPLLVTFYASAGGKGETSFLISMKV